MKLILTRHGHVEGIDPPRFRGRTEVPLTELGRAQAKAVARRIASAWQPVKVYTSPRDRCIATGQEIARACNVANEALEQLDDLDYGEWRWRTHEEMCATYGALFSTWLSTPHLVRFPGGESLQDIVARTADALRLALERHVFETVVFVGHDSVNRALLMQVLDQPLSAYWRIAQMPCSINEIDIEGGVIRVLRINECQHLEGLAEVGGG